MGELIELFGDRKNGKSKEEQEREMIEKEDLNAFTLIVQYWEKIHINHNKIINLNYQLEQLERKILEKEISKMTPADIIKKIGMSEISDIEKNPGYFKILLEAYLKIENTYTQPHEPY